MLLKKIELFWQIRIVYKCMVNEDVGALQIFSYLNQLYL